MKILILLALGLAVSGCVTTPEGGAKTVGCTYLGEVETWTITQEESRVHLPAKPDLKVKEIQARKVGANRYQEIHLYAGGSARLELIQTGGFVLASNSEFKKLTGGFKGVDSGVLDIQKTGDMKYAHYKRGEAPCIVFVSVFGDLIWAERNMYNATLTGYYCRKPGGDPAVLEKDVIAYVKKLKLRD